MANFKKELTDLVQEYLIDGIISAKERQVLLNKECRITRQSHRLIFLKIGVRHPSESHYISMPGFKTAEI